MSYFTEASVAIESSPLSRGAGAYLKMTFTKPTDDAGGLAQYKIEIARDAAFTRSPVDHTATVRRSPPR